MLGWEDIDDEQRAERARALLEDPVLMHVIETEQARLTEQTMSALNPEDRDLYWREHRALQRIVRGLRDVIAKMAMLEGTDGNNRAFFSDREKKMRKTSR